MNISEGHLHAGHRERMRERFVVYGRDYLYTHELLEMLLFYVVPYKDTKPIAKRLLFRFSDLDGIFSATRNELLSVEGVGPKIADMLTVIGELDVFSLRGTINKENDFLDYNKTGEFLLRYFENSLEYETVMITLNAKMEYINMHSLYKADCDCAKVKPKPFLSAAINDGASIVVLAHNHPHGPAFPSNGDVETNKMLTETLSSVGVVLAEHYIVCGNRYVGFVNNLSTVFNQSSTSELHAFLKSKEESL